MSEELKNNENIINEVISIISKFADNDTLKKYEEYLENNKFEENYSFNIFELISDIYYRENFHSDIIAKLFENKIVLKNFLDYIEVDSNKYENYKITREEDKIDILIRSGNNCIIIENKLNWAEDMSRQLFRYYDKCKNSKKLEVDKIVYLSPNSLKQPEEQSIKDIPEELIKIIYGYDGKKKDFYTMVLQKSLEEMNNNEPKEWLLLLEHYLKILRKTGVTKMNDLTDKFYEKIMEDNKQYEKIKLIVDMYNNLSITRINNLISQFKAKYYNNSCCFMEFNGKKRKYVIDIHIKNDYSYLQLFSRGKDIDKIEQDRKDIKTWLIKHDLFEGFDINSDFDTNGRLTKKFKFPEEEKELYEFTKKLINYLEEDIESIYSGK